MKRILMVVLVTALLMLSAGAPVASANAWGQRAGEVCDADDGSGPYWRSAGYKNRGQCVSDGVKTLKAGQPFPADSGDAT